TAFHSPSLHRNCRSAWQDAAPSEYFVPLYMQSLAATACCTPYPRSTPPSTASERHRTLRFMIVLLSLSLLGRGSETEPVPGRPRSRGRGTLRTNQENNRRARAVRGPALRPKDLSPSGCSPFFAGKV